MSKLNSTFESMKTRFVTNFDWKVLIAVLISIGFVAAVWYVCMFITTTLATSLLAATGSKVLTVILCVPIFFFFGMVFGNSVVNAASAVEFMYKRQHALRARAQ